MTDPRIEAAARAIYDEMDRLGYVPHETERFARVAVMAFLDAAMEPSKATMAAGDDIADDAWWDCGRADPRRIWQAMAKQLKAEIE